MSTNIKKLMINTKGSFTVEASIIFSVVFLLIAALVYFLIIMYQYSFLQSVANQAASAGAYDYVNKYYTGTTAKSENSMYLKIADPLSKDKKDEINSYISNKLDEAILASADFYDNFISEKYMLKQLDISIKEQYPLPVENLFQIFGVPAIINLKAEAHAPLDRNADFVRNLDTVADIKRCITNSDNKWVGKDSNINNILDKLLKKN